MRREEQFELGNYSSRREIPKRRRAVGQRQDPPPAHPTVPQPTALTEVKGVAALVPYSLCFDVPHFCGESRHDLVFRNRRRTTLRNGPRKQVRDGIPLSHSSRFSYPTSGERTREWRFSTRLPLQVLAKELTSSHTDPVEAFGTALATSRIKPRSALIAVAGPTLESPRPERPMRVGLSTRIASRHGSTSSGSRSSMILSRSRHSQRVHWKLVHSSLSERLPSSTTERGLSSARGLGSALRQ